MYYDELTIVRKRKIQTVNNIKYMYTIKTDKVGISVNEFEKEISEETYKRLEKNPQYNTLYKDRYIIPYKEHKIELNIFKGIYEGVIFAEIEFNTEKEAKEFEFPSWFGKEISNKITNANMAIKDMRSTIKIMNL